MSEPSKVADILFSSQGSLQHVTSTRPVRICTTSLPIAHTGLCTIVHYISPCGRYAPALAVGQSGPELVCANHAFDKLAPEHAVGDDPPPLARHQLGGAERLGVDIRQDLLSDVVEASLCKHATRHQMICITEPHGYTVHTKRSSALYHNARCTSQFDIWISDSVPL